MFKKTKRIIKNIIKIEKNKDKIRVLVKDKERYKILLELIDMSVRYDTMSIDEKNEKVKEINIKIWELDKEIFNLEKENLNPQIF